MRGGSAFAILCAISVADVMAAWARTSAASDEKPPLVALDWEVGPAAEGCIKADELKEAVEAQLERGVFTFPGEETPETTHIHVHLERTSDGAAFRASASIESPKGRSEGASASDTSTRELYSDGSDCRTLDQPLALVVSVMVGTDVVGAAEPSKDEASRSTHQTNDDLRRDRRPEPILTVHERARPSEPWRVALDASAAAGFGFLPDLAAGAELGVMVAPPTWPAFRVHAVGFLPDDEELAPGASATFTMAYAGAALCPALYAGSIATLHACLGGDVGLLRARSSGFADGRATTRAVPLVDAAVRGSLPFSERLQGLAMLSGLFPTSPDRFVYELPDGREREIHRIQAVSVTAGVGIGFSIR